MSESLSESQLLPVLATIIVALGIALVVVVKFGRGAAAPVVALTTQMWPSASPPKRARSSEVTFPSAKG